mmetsp:Transcript_134048/g.232732  ORF Transcript_134048/g.232732 Transcript_134048/m.232732 type:complete len:146 (+) Transcript_134048:690-1127(+)
MSVCWLWILWSTLWLKVNLTFLQGEQSAHLLQDCLRGTAKTCILTTIAPSASCLEEATGTLADAHRAKRSALFWNSWRQTRATGEGIYLPTDIDENRAEEGNTLRLALEELEERVEELRMHSKHNEEQAKYFTGSTSQLSQGSSV